MEGYAAAFGIHFFHYPEARFPVEYDSQLVGVPLDRPHAHWRVPDAPALGAIYHLSKPPVPALLGASALALLLLPALRLVRRLRLAAWRCRPPAQWPG